MIVEVVTVATQTRVLQLTSGTKGVTFIPCEQTQAGRHLATTACGGSDFPRVCISLNGILRGQERMAAKPAEAGAIRISTDAT